VFFIIDPHPIFPNKSEWYWSIKYQPVLCKYSFKDSNEGAVANEDGRFILNLKNIRLLVVTWLVSDREIALGKRLVI
jgi:hypothetical protein